MGTNTLLGIIARVWWVPNQLNTVLRPKSNVFVVHTFMSRRRPWKEGIESAHRDAEGFFNKVYKAIR